MRKILAMAVLVLAAGGCVTAPRVWWKPGVTRTEMLSDLRAAGEDAAATGRADLDTQQSIGGPTRRGILVEKGMKERGYRPMPETQAPFLGE